MRTCVFVLALAALVPFAGAEITVSVDCSEVVASGDAPLKYGVCVNYLIDSDDYSPDRERSLRDSLKDLNVKAIRWNEGEVGDKMIWSIPPFEQPNAHSTHLRTPGTVHNNWRVDENGKVERAMQLDEVIAVARDLDVELYIIVGIDAIWVEDPSVRGTDTKGEGDPEGEVHKRMTDFAWATEGQSARDMIIAGTRGLALYLKEHAADLDIFLEIGNENYLGDANWKPDCYAEIANALAAAIKRVNPNLHVGPQLAEQYPWTSIGEDGRSWNEVMRRRLDLSLYDHLVVHNYGFGETGNLGSAIEFLETLPAEQRERLELTVTETGTWHLPGTKERWSPNDLRGALYQIRWLGFLQTQGKGHVRTPLFWTTRWLSVLKRGALTETFNAIDMDGDLVPSGQAIKLWNDHVHDQLVKTTVDGGDRDTAAYTSIDSDTGAMTLWLVNNRPEACAISVQLEGCSPQLITNAYLLTGDGPTDTQPSISPAQVPTLARQENDRAEIAVDMQPYSAMVLLLENASE